MKRLALVARADNGGIANQTWQFARRMKPERILIVHASHTTRGAARPERYSFDYGPAVQIAWRAPKRHNAEWLLDGVDAVFSVECWYGTAIPEAAALKGVKTVLQGNPEMTGDEPSDVLWAPTNWRRDALPPGSKIMPFPTDHELFPSDPLFKRDVRQIYHVHSDAMCDRNGTELLYQAAPHINHEVRISIRGGAVHNVEHVGLATIEWLGHHDGMFYEHWPRTVGLFVAPRRFGGLSLPMQEAATLGLPIISLDVAPQASVLPMQGLVRAWSERSEHMRGGQFEVNTCDPKTLARKINEVIQQRHLYDFLAERSRTWAEAISWEALMEHYEAELR